MARKNTNRIVLAISLTIIFGCINKKNSEYDYSHKFGSFVVEINKADSLRFTNCIKSIDLISLETLPDVLIQNIDVLKVSKDKIFILDKNQKIIFVFDHNGKYISKVDKKGKGADNYYNIDDFDIDEATNSVYVLDAIPRRLLQYTYEGYLMNEKRLDLKVTSFYRLNNGFVFESGNYCNDKFCDKVIFCDDKLEIKNTFIAVRNNFDNFHFMSSFNRLVKVSDILIRYVDIDDKIYTFDNKGLLDIGRINFNGYHTDLRFYDQKFNSGGDFINLLLKNNNSASWVELRENSDILFFKFFFNQKTFRFYLSKNTNKNYLFREIDSQLLSGIPINIYYDQMYEYSPAYLFSQKLVDNKAGNNLSQIDSLIYMKYKNLSNIQINSNPILMKYSLGL